MECVELTKEIGQPGRKVRDCCIDEHLPVVQFAKNSVRLAFEKARLCELTATLVDWDVTKIARPRVNILEQMTVNET